VFARHTAGNAHVAGALAYGRQDVTTDRTVTVAGVDRLRARFDANALSGRIAGGTRYETPWIGVTPYAAAQFTTLVLPGYAEQAVSGANTFALNYAARSITASRSELGLRVDRSWALSDAQLTLRGRTAWAHNFDTDVGLRYFPDAARRILRGQRRRAIAQRRPCYRLGGSEMAERHLARGDRRGRIL
jgi:uncharacterized protein with beta-barrel porin domain